MEVKREAVHVRMDRKAGWYDLGYDLVGDGGPSRARSDL